MLAFLEAAAGQTLDDDGVGLAHAVYRETDGNPYFVSEVLRHLVETGAIFQDAGGRWTSESLELMTLPDSLREVIGARVGRLGEVAEQVLSVASVIGRDFDLDLLSRASNTNEDDLLDLLEAAVTASLVRELADSPGRYNFAHALIQHTLYEELGPSRRARTHRLVAEALEELCGDRPEFRVGELSRHWIAATQPIDLAKAIDYTQRAGDAALSALAPADALRYYAQALDLYAQSADPDPVTGIDLAIGLGTAQRQTGDPLFRETLTDAGRRAAEIDDTGRLVAAALANDRGFASATFVSDDDKVQILELALERLSSSDPDRALVIAALCSELAHNSPIDRLESLANEAVAIAEATGDDTTIVRVLNNLFVPLFLPHLLEQSLARTADALVRSERIGDPLLLHFAARWRSEISARAGDINEMDRCIEIAASAVQRIDQPTLRWGCATRGAQRALIAGDPDEAERLATEAFKIGTDSGQPDATVYFGAALFLVNHQRGTLVELVPVIEQMGDDAPGMAPAFIAGILATALADGDRTDEARHLLAQFAAAGFELPGNELWLTGMMTYADPAIECRNPEFAEPLLDLLAPWGDQLSTVGGITAEGPVSHFLGGLATVLRRYDEADDYFARSAAMSERIGAKFFAAQTDLLWGRMHAERDASGDVERARDLLTAARTIATDHGYGNVERRAVAALQDLD